MDEGVWGFLAILAVVLAATWGHYGRGSLARAIRDLLWPGEE